MANKIAVEDYAPLKECFAIITSEVLPDIGLPLEKQALTLISELEKTSLATARTALQMGLNDLVRISFDIPRAKQVSIDQLLTAKGLPTLTYLRLQFSDKVHHLVKKGRVSNDVEYFLLKDVLDSGTPVAFDMQSFQKMLEAYEERQA